MAGNGTWTEKVEKLLPVHKKLDRNPLAIAIEDVKEQNKNNAIVDAQSYIDSKFSKRENELISEFIGLESSNFSSRDALLDRFLSIQKEIKVIHALKKEIKNDALILKSSKKEE